MIIKPILLYATSIWSNACNTSINKIITVQNKILGSISQAKPDETNESIRKKIKYSRHFKRHI